MEIITKYLVKLQRYQYSYRYNQCPIMGFAVLLYPLFSILADWVFLTLLAEDLSDNALK